MGTKRGIGLEEEEALLGVRGSLEAGPQIQCE
jgi:hypothetical protein